MLAQLTQPVSKAEVVRRDHSTLAGGENLPGMEAKTRHAAQWTAYQTVIVLRSDGACSILYNCQSVSFGDSQESMHVRRETDLMNYEDRSRARCNRFFDSLGVEIESNWVDVGEYRSRANISNGVGRSDKGQTRADDFVAWSESHSNQREVKCSRAGGHSDRVIAANIRRELSLEFGYARALRYPP